MGLAVQPPEQSRHCPVRLGRDHTPAPSGPGHRRAGRHPDPDSTRAGPYRRNAFRCMVARLRSEEHTSELQSLMRISYADFCLKKKTTHNLIMKDSTKYNKTVISIKERSIVYTTSSYRWSERSTS